jgi:hypothetical protein
MDPGTMQRGWFLLGVFLVSGSVLTVQLLLSRIYSVTTWYHLSFLVISIAMFGMTLGAVRVYRGDAAEQRASLPSLAAKGCFKFGVLLPFAAFISVFVPIIHSEVYVTAVLLPMVALTANLVFYFGGVVISLCLTRSPFKVSEVYGYDLLGAAIGCLVALFLMESIDTPSALIIAAAGPLFAGLCFLRSAALPRLGGQGLDRTLLGGGIVLCLLIGSANAFLEKPLIYPRFPKGEAVPHATLDLDRWNSISRITLSNEKRDKAPFSWGVSSKRPKSMRATERIMIIDGDAGTPQTRFDGTSFGDLDFLTYDLTSLAYRLPGLERAAVIGVGGGRDVLTAKYFGVESVVGLDVNAIQIDLLQNDPYYRTYTGFDKIENVELIHSEARSWFARNRASFDIIQMSLVDTWASTGAGAFALSENGLYTIEGWRVFMDDLADGGVFTVSRWMSRGEPAETGRILSLAVGTLLERGAGDPSAHIFLAATKSELANISTLVVSKDPLTDTQVNALRTTVQELDFDIIVTPGEDPADALLRSISGAKNLAELDAVTKSSFLKLFPPTDKQPFFFNQAPLGDPMALIDLIQSERHHVFSGQARASLNLLFIILFSAVMVASVILLPLRRSLRAIDAGTIFGGTAYFFLIGLGFMLLEISMLQTMGLFLGHPSLSLAVVLFSLILSAGIGSLLSGRLPLDRGGRMILWIGLTVAYFLAMGLTIHWIFLELTELTLILRALACLAFTIPGGILLGFGFPTGMTLCERRNSRITPWLWGINGATGVLGSAVAIALNISYGLDKTMMIGALCYALLLPAALYLAKARAS